MDIPQSEHTQDLSLLYRALSNITGQQEDVRALAGRIAGIVVHDFRAHECEVFLLSDDQTLIVCKAYCGPRQPEEDDSFSMDLTALVTSAIRSGETIYTPDVREDPRYHAQNASTLSEFVVPLRAYGEVIGVINLESPRLHDFNERTRGLVTAFAQNAALAVQNAKLFEAQAATIASLREMQARFTFFLEHTSEGVYRVDYDPPIPLDLPLEEQYRLSRERGHFGECNLAIARMYGYTTREQMLAAPYFVENEGYEASMQANLAFYRNGYITDDHETEEFTPSGQKAFFLNNAIGIIQDGYFWGIWGTQRDVTPLKKALAELEQRNAELEQFNYTLSHELKSPIVTMRGFLGHLSEDIASGNGERAGEDLQRISRALDRLYWMINDLLELSRAGRVVQVPREVPFAEIVRSAMQDFVLPENVLVEVQPDLPSVCVDRERMIEVLRNLLENAVKFTSAQPQPQIAVGVRAQDDEKVFYVKDNGIGIDPAYHERVFDLFERLDAQTEGTGIGLTLVKRIIESHGGRVWVESEGLRRGTTICFTLPLATP